MIDSLDDGSSLPSQETGDFKKSRRRKQAAPVDLSKLDRLPPHSLEAEQGVLGCMLIAPNECIGTCLEKFKRGAESFYDLRHQLLYELLVTAYDKKEPIDLITITQTLRDNKQLEAVGGVAYLSSLMDAVPSAANLPYYADIVKEKHLLRRVISTFTQTVANVYEFEGEIDKFLDEVEREVLKINEDRAVTDQASIKDLVHKAINTIEEFHSRQGMLTGISTGFAQFDKMTTGMHPGEMVVIAARPSMGKTSLAMNIAESVALDQKLGVGVFSLEMTAESLVLRMLCSRARVNLRSLREGFLAERDFAPLTAAAGQLAGSKLVIDDTSGLSILQLRARARRMHQQHGIKLFVIDYLQLLNSTSRRTDQNRQQEIADISSGIKALAKELEVPVIVLAQLNRELEKDRSRKPRLSDLRESGSIEQDADLVCLLYDPNRAEEEEAAQIREEQSEGKPVNLLIAKQRNGPTGDVPLVFLKGFTRFESAARISDNDVPE